MRPSGDVEGRFVVDSGEDSGEFRCLEEEILKNAKNANMRECGLVFRRVAFVSLVEPSVSVGGWFVVNSCEDLVKIGGLEGEIWQKL